MCNDYRILARRGLVAGLWLVGVLLCAVGPVQAAAHESNAGKELTEQVGLGDEGPTNARNAFLHELAEQAIWTIIVFVLLLVVLRKTAWKPMLDGLQRREDNIRAALEEAQKARDDARLLREQYDAEMKKAAENAREIIEGARRDATRLFDEERAKAKAEIHAERDRLHRELNQAKDHALHDIWKQSTQLATLIAFKAIGRQITADDQGTLLNEALTEMQSASTDHNAFMGGKA